MGVKAYVLIAVVAYLSFLLIQDREVTVSRLTKTPFEWPASLTYSQVRVAPELNLHVVSGGNPNSEHLMLFVHGFPETAISWKDYLLHFSKSYYVLAPDTRYVNNSQPTKETELTLDVLADDLAQLIKSTKQKKAILVAHDWGSAIAWSVALKYPELVSGYVTFNIPHLHVYRGFNLRHLPLSLGHIWYFLFWGFGGPAAQWRVTNNDYSWLQWFVFESSRPGTFSEAQLSLYRESYRKSGDQLLAYYRMGCRWLLKSVLPPGSDNSVFASMFDHEESKLTVKAPVLQLFGADDGYVDQRMIVEAVHPRYVSHPKSRAVMCHASHWQPKEEVNRSLYEMELFLGEILKK